MTIDQKQHQILHGKNIAKIIMLLAIPIMLSNFIKTLHDFVDMFLVSQIEGTKEVVDAQVSAVVFTTPIINVFQGLATGLMIAGAAMMSQYIGAKKFENARRVSGQLMLLCIILGFLFNAIIYVMAPDILRWMNATGELYYYSLRYVRVRSFELASMFIFFAFQATRQSMGDTVTPVIVNVLAVILNIIFTYIFISVFKMDLAGAALGTVIGNVVVLPTCFHLLRSNHRLNLSLTWDAFKFDKKIMGKIFNLGWPAAISQAFTSLGFVLVNSIIAGYNQDLFDSIGVGNRINQMLLFPAMGIGGVLATFVGQNIGAGNRKRARKGFGVSLILILLVTSIGTLIIIPFRTPLSAIFLKEEEAIALAAKYLMFLLGNLPLMAIFQSYIGAYQGAGRTDLVLILSTIRLWVMRLPMLYAFLYLFNVGDSSIWYAMIISNAGAGILGWLLYQFVDYKPRVTGLKKRLNEIALE